MDLSLLNASQELEELDYIYLFKCKILMRSIYLNLYNKINKKKIILEYLKLILNMHLKHTTFLVHKLKITKVCLIFKISKI